MRTITGTNATVVRKAHPTSSRFAHIRNTFYAGTHQGEGRSRLDAGWSVQPKTPQPEQTDQPDRDQVDGDDKTQQARHDQNENAGQQRDQWNNGDMNIQDDDLP
jgi:hypothetical protein